MPDIDVGDFTYSTYADVEFADEYLSADVERATTWMARSELDKGRGLVSATRLLQRMGWASGEAPSTDAAPSPVPEATSMLAADILTTPALSSGSGTGSNTKRVKAGSAEVEFFRPVEGTPLPQAVWDLLRPLLGGTASAEAWGLVGGTDQCSRFDRSDWTPAEPFR